MGLLYVAASLTDSEMIQRLNSSALPALKRLALDGFGLLWSKKVGQQIVAKTLAEAQATLDAFPAADQAKLFIGHGNLQGLISMVDPTWVPLVPPFAYAIDQATGKVTLS